MLEPNPRTISRELLTRDEFIPATTLNLLAGAWIQFEVHDWFSHGKNEAESPWVVPLADDDPWPDAPDGDPAHAAGPERGPGRAADVRHRRHALVGRLADLRPRPRVRRQAPLRRAREDPDRRARAAAGGRLGPPRPRRRRRQLLGRARAPPLAVHARAQRGLRPPARGAPGALRRRALRQGAARRRGADGEDPHRRLDAGDHRAPDDGARAAHELVGPRGREARQALRPADEERGHPRDPGLADELQRRPVLAHRGVRVRVPDAPADPGRLQLPRARRRPAAAGADAAGARRAAGARPAERGADGRPPLLVRHLAPGRDHAPQLPEVPPALRPGRRRARRPRRDRHPPLSASAACRGTTSSAGSST